MKVILLEKVPNLGTIGDLVNVKNGYARNYLLPQHKSLRATEANLKYFEEQRSKIEEKNLKAKQEAEKIASNMSDVSVTVIRQASDSGFLFGSVRPGDIVEELAKQGFNILKSQLKIRNPLKTIGVYQIGVQLHPEVTVDISLKIETMQQQEPEEESPEVEDNTSESEKNTEELA